MCSELALADFFEVPDDRALVRGEVAGGATSVKQLKRRFLGGAAALADPLREGAARVEAAAGGRVEQARRGAGDRRQRYVHGALKARHGPQ